MRAPSRFLVYLSVLLLLPVPQLLAGVAGVCPFPMFAAARSYPTGGDSPWFVVTGDFNNDGQADVAEANFSSSSIAILLGNGDGTLQAPKVTAVGSDPAWLATADFNKDGNLDLAVACANGVYVLLGNGNGTFRTGTNVYSGFQ